MMTGQEEIDLSIVINKSLQERGCELESFCVQTSPRGTIEIFASVKPKAYLIHGSYSYQNDEDIAKDMAIMAKEQAKKLYG